MRSIGFVVAVLLAGLLAACGASRPEETTVATETVGESEPSTTGRAAAPPIEGISLDGEKMSLSDFRGRPVLINVWSSW